MDIYKKLNKQAADLIKKLESENAPPIYQLTIQDARKALDTFQETSIEKLPVQIQDLTISTPPNEKLSLRIVRPTGNEKLPAVVYFHGGGWILGNKHTHDRLIREIAYGAHAAVVFVNYTPSPEAKYPTAIEEAYAATKYIVEHGHELNLDTSFLAVAGDSVGGNMAIVTTLLAKERGGPKIDYQVLFYPVTDANFENASYKEFAEGPWLTKAAMEWFWNAYEPTISARKKATVTPLQASLEELKGLPPALIITDENDVLRDEGEAFAHKLMQAGVEVNSVRYLGMIHDFVMLNPLSSTLATQSAIALACSSLQQAYTNKKRLKQKKAA